MEEDIKKDVETGEKVDDVNTDYLAAIKELKEKSVDRSEYEKLKAENRKLLDSIINGGPESSEETPKTYSKEEIQNMRKELFDPDKDFTNLEYMKRVLELRDALLANGEDDPFLPHGKQISPTKEDEERAEISAQVFRECVEYAEGDSEAFTNELMRRTRDIRLPKQNKK